jgi:hypothetical protein
MDHSSNILNKVRYFLSNAFVIIRQRLTYQSSLSQFKKPTAISESKVESSSLLHIGPVVNLELRKNHPLFVEYHFGFLRGGLVRLEKKKSH